MGVHFVRSGRSIRGMLADIVQTVRSAGNPLVDFIFPRVCYACGGSLPPGANRVCRACFSSMRRVDKRDSAYQATLRRAGESDAISSLVIPWFFEKEGILQALLHELKYRRCTVLGVELGREIGQILLACTDERIDGWIPVPLHISKLRERGFNQSLFIGRGVEAVTRIPRYDGVLERVRYTPSQTALTIPMRAMNVSGAFRVPPERVRRVEGRTFLLVDDVVTTGATMQACGSALRAAGARAVLGCAIAIAQYGREWRFS